MAGLLFLACTMGYAMRVNLSIAIVAMVDKNQTLDIPVYDWDSDTQSFILSSFFWGYFLCMIPSGILARTMGSKILVTLSVGIASLCTVLIPISTSLIGWIAPCTLMFINGLTQGAIYPCVYDLVSKWIPPNERGRVVSFILSGGQFGPIVSLPLSGYLTGTLGWPFAFYVFGGAGLIWCVFWLCLSSSTPENHPFLSNSEREFIKLSLKEVEPKNTSPTPWKAVFTSRPMWVILFTHIGYSWGLFTIVTEMPSFLKHVLKFDIKSNGLLSSIPYISKLFVSVLAGFIADFIRKRNLLKLLTIRKLFTFLGMFVPGVSMGALGYVPAGWTTISVTLLVVALGFNGCAYQGFFVSHIDLAPSYAGTLFAMTSTLASFGGIFPPIATGKIVIHHENIEEWRKVFWISASLYMITCINYMIFGKAHIQPWNDAGENPIHTTSNAKVATVTEKATIDQ